MTTVSSAGVPALPVGSFVPSRFGRGWSAFLWLVFALVDSWGPLTGGIIQTPVTWRLTRTGVVLPRILPILATPAAREVAAELVKALVNALHAAQQAANLTFWLVASMHHRSPGHCWPTHAPSPDQKRTNHIDPVHARRADQGWAEATDLAQNMIKIAARAKKR